MENLIQKIIGSGDAALNDFIRRCTAAGGSPVIRTHYRGQPFPGNSVVVACMGRAKEVPGGTIAGVSPTFLAQLQERRTRRARGRVVGHGDEALKDFVRRCLQLGGTPTVRTRYKQQPFPGNAVVVACMGKGRELRGGTVLNVSPETIAQLEARKRGKYKALMDRRPAPRAPRVAPPAPAAPVTPPEITPTFTLPEIPPPEIPELITT